MRFTTAGLLRRISEVLYPCEQDRSGETRQGWMVLGGDINLCSLLFFFFDTLITKGRAKLFGVRLNFFFYFWLIVETGCGSQHSGCLCGMEGASLEWSQGFGYVLVITEPCRMYTVASLSLDTILQGMSLLAQTVVILPVNFDWR